MESEASLGQESTSEQKVSVFLRIKPLNLPKEMKEKVIWQVFDREISIKPEFREKLNATKKDYRFDQILIPNSSDE